MCCFIVGVFLSVSSAFAAALLLQGICHLLQVNIMLYRDLWTILCLKIELLWQKEEQKDREAWDKMDDGE
jgi:hypothetical protein